MRPPPGPGHAPGPARFITRSGGRSRPLRCLHTDPDGLSIVMFHEGAFLQWPGLLRSGLLDSRTHLLFTFSWNQGAGQLRTLRGRLEQAVAGAGADPALARDQVTLLMNSEREVADARAAFPGFRVLHFNNAALLDEESIRILPTPRLYRAVLNSKPLAFKRHHLSRLVGGTLFITYDVNEPDHGRTARVVLEDCGPAGIVRNQPPERVVALLNSSEVGLILSAAEGACYASLEYLLCGLPVVSTPSLGGRDAFYDAANAIIVEPKAEAVRDGVALALRRLREGEMDREAIRREAVARMAGFRRVLAGEVARILEGHGRRVPDGMAWLTDLLRRDSKLREHRNFWVQEVEAA